MTVSPLGIPFAVYNRQLIATPYSRWGQQGNIVTALIDWSQYQANGATVGTLVPAFVVQVQFQGVATVPRNFVAQSVYINNLGSILPIYIFFPDTGYEVVAPANSEGWYPIITRAPIAWVFGLSFQDGRLPLTTIFFTDLLIPPYVNVAIPQNIINELASPIIGGSSNTFLASITVQTQGQSYTAGTLTVTGGNGAATAVGSLDIWGRFTSVQITNAGADFTGLPIITATAPNPAAAAFNGAANYTVGEKTTYAGTEWMWDGAQTIQCGAVAWTSGGIFAPNAQTNYSGVIYVNISGRNNEDAPPPAFPKLWALVGSAVPDSGFNWLNSGTPGGTAATFNSTIGSTIPSTPTQTQGYAPPALGDQGISYSGNINGAGVFQDNIFGSPFGSGFIYLTNFFSALIGGTDAKGNGWVFQTASGFVLFNINAANKPGYTLLNLQGMNLKLDATQQWQLNCTGFTVAVTVLHGLCWTYSQF